MSSKYPWQYASTDFPANFRRVRRANPAAVQKAGLTNPVSTMACLSCDAMAVRAGARASGSGKAPIDHRLIGDAMATVHGAIMDARPRRVVI